MHDEDTIPCPPPPGCRAPTPFEAFLLTAPPGLGAKRETTAQRIARESGEKRFNAYGCK